MLQLLGKIGPNCPHPVRNNSSERGLESPKAWGLRAQVSLLPFLGAKSRQISGSFVYVDIASFARSSFSRANLGGLPSSASSAPPESQDFSTEVPAVLVLGADIQIWGLEGNSAHAPFVPCWPATP